jgi:hypothetical protein
MTLRAIAAQVPLSVGSGVLVEPDSEQALCKGVRLRLRCIVRLVVVLQHQHVHHPRGRLVHEPPLLHILVDWDAQHIPPVEHTVRDTNDRYQATRDIDKADMAGRVSLDIFLVDGL